MGAKKMKGRVLLKFEGGECVRLRGYCFYIEQMKGTKLSFPFLFYFRKKFKLST